MQYLRFLVGSAFVALVVSVAYTAATGLQCLCDELPGDQCNYCSANHPAEWQFLPEEERAAWETEHRDFHEQWVRSHRNLHDVEPTPAEHADFHETMTASHRDFHAGAHEAALREATGDGSVTAPPASMDASNVSSPTSSSASSS